MVPKHSWIVEAGIALGLLMLGPFLTGFAHADLVAWSLLSLLLVRARTRLRIREAGVQWLADAGV